MVDNDPELSCPICNRVGQNIVDDGWFVCKCGHAIKEVEDE
jgi:hypothetical protein